jgi:hypothetical protein
LPAHLRAAVLALVGTAGGDTHPVTSACAGRARQPRAGPGTAGVASVALVDSPGMARHPRKVQLLHGPYLPPALRRGDRATCLFRDDDVIIKAWSDGRIAWPRCRRPGQKGGSGLLVDEELARAVRLESSLAVQYWWGVRMETVWRWRQALGVPQMNDGSHKLRQSISRRLRGAHYARGDGQPTSWELGKPRIPGRTSRPWTGAEDALLSRLPGPEVARRTGQTLAAVYQRRHHLFGHRVGEHDRLLREILPELRNRLNAAQDGRPETP